MHKLNCWENKNCWRGQNPTHSGYPENCPAFTEKRLNGINGGINGGRACWAIPGTNPLIPLHEKIKNCLNCSFFKLVQFEEERNFIVMGKILERLK